jgi:primosomal protein N' (replication factor Y)
MKEELNVRQQLKYPPYSRMILSTCTAPAQNALHMVVQRWSDEMRRLVRRKPIEILGPVPPIVARVKNRYREHILIKGTMSNTDKADLRASFENTVEKIRGARSVDLRWDVDPESFY